MDEGSHWNRLKGHLRALKKLDKSIEKIKIAASLLPAESAVRRILEFELCELKGISDCLNNRGNGDEG